MLASNTKYLRQPTRIRELFTNRSFSSFYLSSVLEFLRFLLKLGIRPEIDGWRKYASAFLRTEDSRFLFPAFKLKIGSEASGETLNKKKQWIIEQLVCFLKTNQHLWKTKLKWHRKGASIQPNSHLDIVWAEFDNENNLSGIRVYFDANEGLLNDNSDHPFTSFFTEAYNRTISSGRQRPYQLMMIFKDLVRNKTNQQQALEFMQRVMDGVFIHFETCDEDHKLNIPDFSLVPHPGGGAFNILCRLRPPAFNEVDLWVHINHVLQDGLPILEAISQIRKKWGTTGNFVLPRLIKEKDAYTCVQPVHNDSGRELVYVHQHISFGHLLLERKRLNQKYSHLLKGKITVAGMIMWGLGNQPFLRNIKITLIIDVDPSPDTSEPRTLGFVTCRPNAAINNNDKEDSFVQFQEYLNEAIELVKSRKDQIYFTMKGQAILPAIAYEKTFSMIPDAVRDIGGKISLTIVPEAEYCVPPADDTKDAIINIGNIKMPTADGELAGVVCIVSVKDDAHQYWESVYNAITFWHI